jgi:hypothetical protein
MIYSTSSPIQGWSACRQIWRVPYCESYPDSKRRERYDCRVTVYRNDRTCSFNIRQENLGVANLIPEYIENRLDEWRPSQPRFAFHQSRTLEGHNP